jgi:hypothetical protein
VGWGLFVFCGKGAAGRCGGRGGPLGFGSWKYG